VVETVFGILLCLLLAISIVAFGVSVVLLILEETRDFRDEKRKVQNELDKNI
jgi:hypothetical protein